MSPRQVLLLQGAGPRVHDGWDRRLAASLESALGPDVEVRYPRLPDEDDPTLERWAAAIRSELEACDDGVAVVAHSVGGTALMAALGTAPVERRIGAVVLVAAPFLGDGGWPDETGALPPDLGARIPAATTIHVVHGLADQEVPPGHAGRWAELVPATLHLLPDRDHQLGDDLREVAAILVGPPIPGDPGEDASRLSGRRAAPRASRGRAPRTTGS